MRKGDSPVATGIKRLVVTLCMKVCVCVCDADDSYDRNLYPPGSCATIGSGKPSGPNGTECLYSELQDYETFR